MVSHPAAPPLLADEQVDRAARRLKVLGDPVRLRLLNALRLHGEVNVQDLMDITGQRQANASKHLGILLREGLVQKRREGPNVFYALATGSLPGICLLVVNSLREED